MTAGVLVSASASAPAAASYPPGMYLYTGNGNLVPVELAGNPSSDPPEIRTSVLSTGTSWWARESSWLGMPARKLPTPHYAAAARRMLLDGLARDADILELVSELAPLHPRNNTFPGEVFLRLTADALEWCGASREEPLALEGIQERFLPECTFR